MQKACSARQGAFLLVSAHSKRKRFIGSCSQQKKKVYWKLLAAKEKGWYQGAILACPLLASDTQE